MVQTELKIKTVAIYLFALCLTAAGCKKFTSEPYDNRAQLQTAEQYQQVLVNAYPVRHDLFTDILTDDFEYHAQLAQASNITDYLPMYQWKDDYPDGITTGPARAYEGFYQKIYLANLALEGIESASGSEEQKAAVRGEALLVRAYCHFILVNLFGMHYEAGTASTNLGIPLVTVNNRGNINTYRRNTVKEVYDQVESDIAQGIAQLKNGGAFVSANPYHFSVATGNALMARLKLYKGEWDQAVKYSEDVINERGYQVRRLADDIPFYTSNGMLFFATRYMDPASHPNILSLAYNPTMGPLVPTGYFICGFFPSDYMIAQYFAGNTDLRRRVFVSVGTVIDARYIALKFATQANSPSNTPIKTPYFNMEEVILTHAEAALRSNDANGVQKALNDVESIRKLRYAPYTPLNTGITKDELLEVVLLERRKELINEGLRWYDIKRLKLSVTHRLARGNTAVEVLKENDLRKAIQIPRMEQERNIPIASELNPR
ncbi:RagB/SusD family nutrient uptake outer membrane protein [Chitinophaga solisilvae]|uniref:RagB/SusD family nutrient uptake outer membrane protein n=1 Tax=Chitinophaga solisilvae TaxID=1233460 RepID=A0A3S1B0Q1_9BACT|nr:RagB/SusD family nutrient uptake outer membrane protein [Chitinophaga solisilvae]NSL87693.1 RagB/SusD family nutrient uptake outer membrane protein [Chitinophaga solisilvae]